MNSCLGCGRGLPIGWVGSYCATCRGKGLKFVSEAWYEQKCRKCRIWTKSKLIDQNNGLCYQCSFREKTEILHEMREKARKERRCKICGDYYSKGSEDTCDTCTLVWVDIATNEPEISLSNCQNKARDEEIEVETRYQVRKLRERNG